MKKNAFDKKVFTKAVEENLKTLYRKTLKEANQQEIYQAVAAVVK